MASPSPVVPVLSSMFIAYVALGVVGPLVPLMLLSHGVPAPEIGLVASCYSAGFIIGTLVLGRVIGRIGHRAGMLATSVFAGLTVAALTVESGTVLWAVLRAGMGLGHAGICIVAESWLNSHAGNHNRGRIFSGYLLTTWGGSSLGPLAIGAFPASGGLLLVAALVLSLTALPVLRTRATAPPSPPANRPRMGLLALMRLSPVGIACCLAAGLCNTAYYAMSPVALAGQGHSNGEIASFLVAINLAGMLVQMPIGLLSDRIGRRQVAVSALGLGAATGLLLFHLADAGIGLLIAAGIGLACTTSGLYGLGASQTNDRIAADGGGDTVAASGGLLLAWAIGSTAGPTVAGAAMAWIGPAGLFFYLACVLAAVAVFTAARMMLRSDAPRDASAAFVDLPPAGHT